MTASPGEHRRRAPLGPFLDRIESAAALDGPAKAVAARVRSITSPTALKEAVSGTWLGHAVHPLLTDVVIGSFLSATMLDVVGGDDDGRASRRLIAVGIAAYPATALTGASDWADTEPADDGVRRAGLVHATTNAVALSLYAASLAARRRGARGKGVALGLGGAGALSLAAFLGGHLTFAKGVGPDQTVFDPGPTEWTAACDGTALADGRPTRVVVDDTPVLLLRDGGALFAIHDRCSHRGCSLTDGELDGDEIVCACHGSRFDRADGSVRRGPATAPQPAFDVRDAGGTVEIRRRRPVSGGG
jgi:nitrite reductase/ring-hydroxylating ferredoxin subunit